MVTPLISYCYPHFPPETRGLLSTGNYSTEKSPISENLLPKTKGLVHNCQVGLAGVLLHK